MTPFRFIFALAIVLAPAAARAEVTTFHAALSGKAEQPATKTQAKGELNLIFESGSRKATWTLTYSGLSGPVVEVELTGPAPAAGGRASVRLAGAAQSPTKGSLVLSPDQAQALQDGKLFVNVRSARFKRGEIGGRLEKGGASKTG